MIANAAILGDNCAPEDMSEDTWRNVFATNLDGVMHTCRSAYPLLKKCGRGTCV